MSFSLKRYRQRLKLVDLLRNTCSRCGLTKPRVLKVMRKPGTDKFPSYAEWAADVDMHPGHYELICANCNWDENIEKNLKSAVNRRTAARAGRQGTAAELLETDLAVIGRLLVDGSMPLKQVVELLAPPAPAKSVYAKIARLERAGLIQKESAVGGQHNQKMVSLVPTAG